MLTCVCVCVPPHRYSVPLPAGMGSTHVSVTSPTTWLVRDMVGNPHWLRLSHTPWTGEGTGELAVSAYAIDRQPAAPASTVTPVVPEVAPCVHYSVPLGFAVLCSLFVTSCRFGSSLPLPPAHLKHDASARSLVHETAYMQVCPVCLHYVCCVWAHCVPLPCSLAMQWS